MAALYLLGCGRGFIKGQALGKLSHRDNNSVGLVDHLVESFTYKEVQIKTFCLLHVETSCPPDENINETPGWWFES